MFVDVLMHLLMIFFFFSFRFIFISQGKPDTYELNNNKKQTIKLYLNRFVNISKMSIVFFKRFPSMMLIKYKKDFAFKYLLIWNFQTILWIHVSVVPVNKRILKCSFTISCFRWKSGTILNTLRPIETFV